MTKKKYFRRKRALPVVTKDKPKTLIIMLILFMSITATALQAQPLLSLNLKNATLEQVISAIEKKTDYRFLYNKNLVNVSQQVSISVNNQSIDATLSLLLKDTRIGYTITDKQIVLQPKSANAQNNRQTTKKTLSGIIVDHAGEAIIGATVVVKGDAAKGTITDIDGKFTLTDVPQNAIIMVSYVGYQPIELPANSSLLTKIVLKEDSELLDEVVVVGYGAQMKVNLTGAVATISGNELAERPVTSLSSSIQGLVPGLTITSGQGRPGQDGAARIRIRGQGTLNNSEPYILIDGIESGSMNQIDQSDIESISILKDAASAAIYGSKASNGVILITTKRGKKGRAVLSYNGNFGWQAPTGLIERMNSTDAATYYNKALQNNGKSPKFTEEEIQKFKDGSEPYKYPNTDWNKLGYAGSGFVQQHNVNISGGSENITYMTSFGYLGQEGIMKNSNRRQFNARSNVDITLSEYITVHSNLAYINNTYKDPTNSYVRGGSEQIIRQINRIAPWIVHRYEDGTYGTIGDGNPIAWIDLNQTINRENQNFAGVAAIDYHILDGLKLTAQGAYVANMQDYKEFAKDIQYNANKYHGPNRLEDRFYLWNRKSFDGLLNYDKIFGKHHLKALLGSRTEKFNYKEARASRTDFPNNDLRDMDAGTEATQKNSGYTRELAMISYFGRINYDFEGKYLFEANLRADASSRFSPEHHWGYFPSLSAGWRLSEEQFMENARSWLQSLKIRGSWGQLGNQDALTEYYPWLVTYNIGENYPFNGTVETGIAQKSHKLASISWEKTTTWGIGLDMTLLRGLNISLDYYNRRTNGIIMEVPSPATFGLGAYLDNVGAMKNRGVEISAEYRKQWGDWSIGTNGNFTLNRNEILNLGGVERMIDGNYINKIGAPYRSFYVYVADGLFQSNEEADEYTSKYGNPFKKKFKAGDIRYKDTDGDGKLTASDRDLTYSEHPRFTYGLNLSAGWKNVGLSIFMQGASGVSRYFDQEAFGDFSGDTSHPATAWFDAWSPENPNGKFPYIAEGTVSASHPGNPSTFWVFSANYLRIKNMQLSYSIPSQWLSRFGISQAKVYYAGENLFKIDNLPINVDPEAPSGRASHYPQVSTNSIGISLTF